MTTHQELQQIMEFDHPINVRSDGTVTDAPGVYAPEVYHVEGEQHPKDVEVLSDEWETFSVGYTGQYSYNGAVMHASEYIGGRLADDILATPGTYVVTSVEVYPEDQEDGSDEPAGWTILRRKDVDPARHAGLGVGHIWFNTKCPAYTTLMGVDCTCNEQVPDLYRKK